MGVTGELLTIYAALPYVQKTGLYSVTLPNKYNFSFDYHTFLIVVMISYIPRKPPQACSLPTFGCRTTEMSLGRLSALSQCSPSSTST